MRLAPAGRPESRFLLTRRTRVGQNWSRSSSSSRRVIRMTGTLLNLFLLLLVILGSVLCVFGPVTVLGVMFWKWHKELAASVRLRQARSTQVR